MSIVGRLIKARTVPEYYREQEEKSLGKGIEANTVLRRIGSCLSIGSEMNIAPSFYQWFEERSPNHHPYASPIVWPAGLIEIESHANRTDEILGNERLREFDFEIIMGGNSSGGVEVDSLDKYNFSVFPTQSRYNGYRQVEEDMLEEFENSGGFRSVDGQVVDFVRLEGLDGISGCRIYLDIGNKPPVRKQPKGFFGIKNIGQLPPPGSFRSYFYN